MLLYKTKRYLQRKILLKVPQRNILVTIQEQIRDNSWWQYDQIAKWLGNAKRIQSNCKICDNIFRSNDFMYGGLYPPDHFILHVGTNDLSPKKSSKESIINMACQLKNEIHDVSVSTIILRTDDKKWNEKGMKVNLYLKELSKEKNIFLIHNSRKIKAQHLNHSSNPPSLSLLY